VPSKADGCDDAESRRLTTLASPLPQPINSSKIVGNIVAQQQAYNARAAAE